MTGSRDRVRLILEDCVGPAFEARCLALADLAASFHPDLIVGVRLGGAVVARAMVAHPELVAPVVEVTASRPGTARKARFRLDLVSRALPHRLLDRIRTWEIERGANHFVRDPGPRPRFVELADDARAAIARATRLLVVDDAIDSGSTLRAVLAVVAEVNPVASVKVAALTQTYPRPLIAPDFVTAVGVVLRLPWSSDAARARPPR